MKISLVIPIYYDQDNLPVLYGDISTKLKVRMVKFEQCVGNVKRIINKHFLQIYTELKGVSSIAFTSIGNERC